MKEELLADLESQKTLLLALNSSLRQNHALHSQTYKTHLDVKKYLNWELAILMLSIIPLTFLLAQNVSKYDFESKSHYVIENLRGDTIDTWAHWNIVDNEQITVNIVNANLVSADKIDAIKSAILSKEKIVLDDSLLHKAPLGTVSTYYVGWQGAVGAISSGTKFSIPHNFEVITSPKGEGEIIITLSKYKDTDGYTGYTKSVVEDERILKADITIYDVDNISTEQLQTIVRHEFGHALGIGHSTAPEDLMAPIITTLYPYISQCDIDTLAALYDGKTSSEITCSK